jgi:hypothetical protein
MVREIRSIHIILLSKIFLTCLQEPDMKYIRDGLILLLLAVSFGYLMAECMV